MSWLDLVSLALARLRRSPGRATLATLGVALGAALLVGLLAIAQGIQDEAEASAVWLASPGRLTVTGNHLQDPDVDRLAHLEGAAVALPVLVTPLSVDRGGHHLLGVAGLGLAADARAPYRLVAGRALDASQANAVVLSRSASDALGFAEPSAAVGSSLTLNGAPSGSREVLISGVLHR